MKMKSFLEEVLIFKDNLSKESQMFLDSLILNCEEKEKPMFTENGLKILKTMRENQEQYENCFNAQALGGLLSITPRSVSGSMKKLISTGHTEKVGSNPVRYGLTQLGKDCEIDN